MKRLFCALLAIILVLAVTVIPAIAAESEKIVQPRYSYIETIASTLSIGKLGLTACSGGCIAYGGASIKMTLTLQKYDGSSWSTVKTWSSTSTTNQISMNKNYAVFKGYTYRVRTSCSVYNASGVLVENGNIYSNQVYY